MATLALPAALQAQVADTLRGRAVLPDSSPAVGAEVMVTPMGGDTTLVDTTGADGGFAIPVPGATAYLVVANLKGFPTARTGTSPFQRDGMNVTVRFAPPGTAVLDTVRVKSRRRERKPDAQQDRGGTPPHREARGFIPPGDAGGIDALAGRQPGVATGPGGISVHGLSPDQTQVTLNGVPVPVTAVPPGAASAQLSTTAYSASSGGFSGGQLALRLAQGAMIFSNRLGTTLELPGLQFTDPASARLGQEYTNLNVDGRHSGPLVDGKARFNVQYDIGRRFTDLATLVSAEPSALARSGISPDSVERLFAVLDGLGIPLSNGAVPEHQSTDNGSVVLGLESWPSFLGNSSSLAFIGSWNRMRGLSLGPTVVPSAGSGRDQYSGVLQGRRMVYLRDVLHVTTATASSMESRGRPYTSLPSGTVTIASDSGGVSLFRFGGAPLASSSTGNLSADLRHSVMWRTVSNRHGFDLGGSLRWERSTTRTSAGLGSFAYASLADLAASTPASLSRIFAQPERTLDALSGALSFGDSWNRPVRQHQQLFVQSGIRAEAVRFGSRPGYNPAVDAEFGRRTDRAPFGLSVSPRLGVSWYRPGLRSPNASAWQRFARRFNVLNAGVGLYVNTLPSTLLASAMNSTGLADGVRRVQCVGDAVPAPDWQAYLDDPSRIPTACADGSTGSVFGDQAPRVEFFADDFRPARTWRGEMGAMYELWGDGPGLSLTLTGNVTVSRSSAQASPVDLNFSAASRFALPDEAGRPVFANTDEIVPATGTPAPGASRRSEKFGPVLEQRSDLHAASEQYSLTLSGYRVDLSNHYGKGNAFSSSGNLTYTYIRARAQARGTTAPSAEAPNSGTWGPSSVAPHHLVGSVTGSYHRLGSLTLYGRLQSGSPFTPLVLGDVNADGRHNDPAFVVDPRAADDSATRANMTGLLARVPGSVRDCLTRQFGRVAGRNSCTGPWSAALDASASLDLRRLGFRRGARASFTFVDVLGGLDQLFNGADVRGWGQQVTPDPILLSVRGFDPAARRYRYDVNQQFGDSRSSRSIFRSPFRVIVSLSVPIGPDEDRQQIRHAISKIESGRRVARSAQEIRQRFAQAGSIAPAFIEMRDSMMLTDTQVEQLKQIEQRFQAAMDSIWGPTAEKLAALPPPVDEDIAFPLMHAARVRQYDLLIRYVREIRGTMTATQLEKTPAYLAGSLDPESIPEVEELSSQGRPIFDFR